MDKILRNEQLFAELNAKVAATTAALAPAGFPRDFVMDLYCECANKRCTERVSIAHEEYIKLKNAPNRFVVRPEHYLPEFERIAAKTPQYWTIYKRLEKLGTKDFEV